MTVSREELAAAHRSTASQLRQVVDANHSIFCTAAELTRQFGYSEFTQEVGKYVEATLAAVDLRVKPSLTKCEARTKITVSGVAARRAHDRPERRLGVWSFGIGLLGGIVGFAILNYLEGHGGLDGTVLALVLAGTLALGSVLAVLVANRRVTGRNLMVAAYFCVFGFGTLIAAGLITYVIICSDPNACGDRHVTGL